MSFAWNVSVLEIVVFREKLNIRNEHLLSTSSLVSDETPCRIVESLQLLFRQHCFTLTNKLKNMKQELEKTEQHFDESSFWGKFKRFAKGLGIKATYMVLLLWYAYQRKETPAWAKRIIMGALGYLVLISDAVPDITPFVGFTDDIGILSFGLVTVASYINEEVRTKARQKLTDWFGNYEEIELKEIDKAL